MSTGRKWGIWDRGKYKFSAEVQRAVDEGGKDLLVVLGINDVEDFAAGCSFSLVSEVLRMDEESRWPNCSNLQYLNMDLLLDQLQQVLKERLHLDEEHPQRGSLLEIAVTRFLPDIVQLLLAHGPEPQLVPRLLQGLYSSEGYKSVRNSRVQMQYILDYNVLLKHDPSTYFGAYCIKRTEKTSELERTTSSVKSSYAVTGYRDLGKLLGEDEDGSASMAWVHIPSSSVRLKGGKIYPSNNKAVDTDYRCRLNKIERLLILIFYTGSYPGNRKAIPTKWRIIRIYSRGFSPPGCRSN